MLSTIKEAWLDGLYRSGKIEWLLNSSELAQRNIRSMTEFASLELSA